MKPATVPTQAGGMLVCAPLRIEARTVAAGLPANQVIQTGAGARRSRRAAVELACRSFDSFAVVGFCGAVSARLRPGDVVVATEVRDGDDTVACDPTALLAGELRRAGLRVHVGPVRTTDHVVRGGERARLSDEGILAVDMESSHLIGAAAGRPRAVVRVVVDTPDRPLVSPHTLTGGTTACRALGRLGAVLARWGAAVASRKVLLASPRSFCAGVERAIQVVERALEIHGPPVYVRKQIVHNVHVVRDLERRGAVFVDELDQVPPRATAVFSAHGVAPSVREQARTRELRVIDATCPLVTKVHAEARRFASSGDLVLLIGHAGHEETEGTLGEIPDSGVLVTGVEDVERLETERTGVSYLMQTTLATDEVTDVVDAIRERFPDARGPGSEDICYATTNRQHAVKEVAGECDLMLVVGSANSSNSRRLVEVAGRAGTRAELIDDPADIELSWLAGVETVGVTAGASAPPDLVTAVVAALRGLGDVAVDERPVTSESVYFNLPKEVRS